MTRPGFISLSRILIAAPDLDDPDAADLHALLVAAHGTALDNVLDAWDAKPADVGEDTWLRSTILPAHSALCADIALSWLFGGPFANGAPAALVPGQAEVRARLWFRGRFWELTRSHPPGLSGGYFGHWTYPAER